jgi:predicted lipase
MDTHKLVEFAWHAYDGDVGLDGNEVAIYGMFFRIHHQPNGVVVVAFRGTDGPIDWVYNMSHLKTPFIGDSSVHAGFLKYMHMVYVKLESQIRGTKRIYFTGHSMGGAVALLCGAKFAHESVDSQVYVTTIGCPRVGDMTFKNLCDSMQNFECCRVVRHGDLVTTLPYIGYYHVGVELVVGTPSPFYYVLYNHSINTYMNDMFLEKTV